MANFACPHCQKGFDFCSNHFGYCAECYFFAMNHPIAKKIPPPFQPVAEPCPSRLPPALANSGGGVYPEDFTTTAAVSTQALDISEQLGQAVVVVPEPPLLRTDCHCGGPPGHVPHGIWCRK